MCVKAGSWRLSRGSWVASIVDLRMALVEHGVGGVGGSEGSYLPGPPLHLIHWLMGAEVAGCGWMSIDQHQLNGNMTTRLLGAAPVHGSTTSRPSLLPPTVPFFGDSFVILL